MQIIVIDVRGVCQSVCPPVSQSVCLSVTRLKSAARAVYAGVIRCSLCQITWAACFIARRYAITRSTSYLPRVIAVKAVEHMWKIFQHIFITLVSYGGTKCYGWLNFEPGRNPLRRLGNRLLTLLLCYLWTTVGCRWVGCWADSRPDTGGAGSVEDRWRTRKWPGRSMC